MQKHRDGWVPGCPTEQDVTEDERKRESCLGKMSTRLKVVTLLGDRSAASYSSLLHALLVALGQPPVLWSGAAWGQSWQPADARRFASHAPRCGSNHFSTPGLWTEQKFRTCMSTPCRVQRFLIGMLGSGQCLVNRCQPPKKALPMCQQRVSSLACLQQDLVGQEEWPIGQQWGVLLGWHAWGFLDICLALFLLRTKQGFQDPNLTSEPVSVLGVR